MVLRLILFYVLAITVMLMMTPWNQLAEGGVADVTERKRVDLAVV